MIYIDWINKGTELSFRGMENGKLSIQSESVGLLVIHEAGHSYRPSVAPQLVAKQRYVAAQFHVLNIIERTDFGYLCRRVTEFPVKKQDGRLTKEQRKVLL